MLMGTINCFSLPTIVSFETGNEVHFMRFVPERNILVFQSSAR